MDKTSDGDKVTDTIKFPSKVDLSGDSKPTWFGSHNTNEYIIMANTCGAMDYTGLGQSSSAEEIMELPCTASEYVSDIFPSGMYQ